MHAPETNKAQGREPIGASSRSLEHRRDRGRSRRESRYFRRGAAVSGALRCPTVPCGLRSNSAARCCDWNADLRAFCDSPGRPDNETLLELRDRGINVN